MLKLNAKQLRVAIPQKDQLRQIKRNPLAFVLDNINDTFNIGSFFRLADAIAAEKIYLCGRVVTPPNIKIHRASIGTWRWLEWEQNLDILQTVKKLKQEGYWIACVEQSPKSQIYWEIKPQFPLALVLGNETQGVNKKVIAQADAVLELPMWGVNKSLNVFAAGSIISYSFLQYLFSQKTTKK